jgi:hypothetical protein
MSHEEIHALLKLANAAGDDCSAVNAVFDQHIAHVDTRIRELTQLKLQLSALRQRCNSDQSVDACGILQGLAAMETEQQPGRHTHLG